MLRALGEDREDEHKTGTKARAGVDASGFAQSSKGRRRPDARRGPPPEAGWVWDTRRRGKGARDAGRRSDGDAGRRRCRGQSDCRRTAKELNAAARPPRGNTHPDFRGAAPPRSHAGAGPVIVAPNPKARRPAPGEAVRRWPSRFGRDVSGVRGTPPCREVGGPHGPSGSPGQQVRFRPIS